MKDKKCCRDCGIDISKRHSNAKCCVACTKKRQMHPPGTMTREQIRVAKDLAGKVPREQIAFALGVSLSNLKRSCKDTSFLYYYIHKNNPELVKEICEYYGRYGKVKTQAKYPNIKLRSIIERYKGFSPRQTRWTEKQMHELVKMGGLVSKVAQAKYFNRPGANAGSIQAAWIKKIGTKMSTIHYLPEYRARYFVKPTCPSLQLYFWSRRTKTKSKKGPRQEGVKAYLWCDIQNHFKDDCPEFFKNAVLALVAFQEWIFNSKNPKNNILKMIKQRETNA